MPAEFIAKEVFKFNGAIVPTFTAKRADRSQLSRNLLLEPKQGKRKSLLDVNNRDFVAGPFNCEYDDDFKGCNV